MIPLLLAQVLGCVGTTAHIDQLTPSEAWPGETIVATGTGFTEGVEVELVHGDTVLTVRPIVTGPSELALELPAEVPLGAWFVRVVGDPTPTPPVVETWSPDAEPPCGKRYALATETHRTQRKIAFERIFDGRDRTRHVFLGEQLVRLELTRNARGEGRTCEALWLVDDQGQRWLIADDDAGSLTTQAQTIAASLALPLTQP